MSGEGRALKGLARAQARNQLHVGGSSLGFGGHPILCVLRVLRALCVKKDLVATHASIFLAAAMLAAPALADEPGGYTRPHTPKTGEEIYRQVCQACHMANAMGGTGAATIPALANNPRLMAAQYPIDMVVHGRGAMPYFTDSLTPAQVAEVVTYVRTHFGNHYAQPVTEADVKAQWVPAPKSERQGVRVGARRPALQASPGRA